MGASPYQVGSAKHPIKTNIDYKSKMKFKNLMLYIGEYAKKVGRMATRIYELRNGGVI